MSNTPFHRIAVSRGPLLVCACVAYLIVGCATPWEKQALLTDNTPNIDKIQGPTQRSLRNVLRKQEEADNEFGHSLKPIKGTPEYLAATELYKQEKYAEAQAAFKKVSKKFKKSEIREDALFMQAEAAWQRENYSSAHDTYAVLLKEYPSTRHMDVVSERMFKLGRLWLNFPEVAKLGEINQVNFELPAKSLPPEETPQLPKSKNALRPNFTNKKEPLFDTPGNGIAALTSVWMNDPTGPLADDAMMLVASYHARRGNYVEADRFFQLLRETFPNSPHVQNAFVLGSHVKLMSYQGPVYESRTLQEAQLLKESTLRLYPNLPEADRMRAELVKIEDAKALVLWRDVEFYLRKKNKKAASIYCHQLINEYPKSPYSDQARSKLVELGPEFASGAAFLASTDPKNNDFWVQLLETPPNYRLRRYPMIGAPRDESKPGTKTSKAAQNSRTNPKEKLKSNDSNSQPDDPVDDLEQVPEVEPEAPKPRRRYSPSSPGRLPEDADSDAKQMTTNPAGRVRL